MAIKTIYDIKNDVIQNMDNLLYQRKAASSTLHFSGERDCAEAVEHYCRALCYLSRIKED